MFVRFLGSLIGFLSLGGLIYAQAPSRGTLDRVDDVNGPQVHVVYLIPSDMIDERLDQDGRIETSIAAFQLWMARVTGGHWMRLDTHYGRLDISVLRVKQTVAEIDTTDLLFTFDSLLREAGLWHPQKSYLIYYAGTEIEDRQCAQFDLELQIAVVYLNGTFSDGNAPCYTYPFTASVTEPNFLEMWAGEVMIGLTGAQCFAPGMDWLVFDVVECDQFILSPIVTPVSLPYLTPCPPNIPSNLIDLTFTNTSDRTIRLNFIDSTCLEGELIRLEAGASWPISTTRMARWRAYRDNGAYIGDFTYDDQVTSRRQFIIDEDFTPISSIPVPPNCLQGEIFADTLFTIHKVLLQPVKASSLTLSCREIPRFTLTQTGWSAWYGGNGQEWRFRDAITGELLLTTTISEPFEVRIDGD